MEDKPRAVLKPVEKRESVRGRLGYYQEVIHQQESDSGKERETEVERKDFGF